MPLAVASIERMESRGAIAQTGGEDLSTPEQSHGVQGHHDFIS